MNFIYMSLYRTILIICRLKCSIESIKEPQAKTSYSYCLSDISETDFPPSRSAEGNGSSAALQ